MSGQQHTRVPEQKKAAKARWRPYRVRVCFGDVNPSVPWDKLGYLQWHERAEKYHKAGIRQRQCPDCSKWRWPDQACHGLQVEPVTLPQPRKVGRPRQPNAH
jgi:hypothetical protein